MILPLKTACELSVQDALVHLVAGGVRLGVVDRGVIVHVLRAVDDVQAVQVGVGAFGEDRVGVVAGERAAQRNRVRGEGGGASDGDLQGGDVEGGRALLLDLVMIHHGGIADYDFGDGVGEVGAGAFVGFDDGALGVGANQNQGAGMGRPRRRCLRR